MYFAITNEGFDYDNYREARPCTVAERRKPARQPDNKGSQRGQKSTTNTQVITLGK